MKRLGVPAEKVLFIREHGRAGVAFFTSESMKNNTTDNLPHPKQIKSLHDVFNCCTNRKESPGGTVHLPRREVDVPVLP